MGKLLALVFFVLGFVALGPYFLVVLLALFVLLFVLAA